MTFDYFVKMERFYSLKGDGSLSADLIRSCTDEFREAKRVLRDLIFFIMDNPGCRPCRRCSTLAGKLVLRAASEFYESQGYRCMACCLEVDRIKRAARGAEPGVKWRWNGNRLERKDGD